MPAPRNRTQFINGIAQKLDLLMSALEWETDEKKKKVLRLTISKTRAKLETLKDQRAQFLKSNRKGK